MMFNQYPYLNIQDFNLDWIIKNFNQFIADIKELQDWRVEHEKEYEQLLEWQTAMNNGDFPAKFVESLIKWYESNIIDIIGAFVKQVFFGITDSGYFVVYIPESWSDITFGTSGLDDFPAGIEYGHLTLSY